MDLLDELATAATWWQYPQSATIVAGHGNDAPNPELSSGDHRCDGSVLRTKAHSAGHVDADARVLVAGHRDQRSAYSPRASVTENLRVEHSRSNRD
jgi:hypothetical protein